MAIRVHVPFVPGLLDPGTWRAVSTSGFPYHFLALAKDDNGAYGRLVRRLWAKAETVIICEHDVVPTQEQLSALQSCGHDWCSFGYDTGLYPDGPYLGLARLSGRVMAAHPRAADVALHRGAGKELEVGWWEVDSMLARDLKIRGVEWCRHDPPVRHAHNGPASGVVVN